MRDRRRYLHWLFKAKKRFGLCVLDYMVTSNHIHLLVKDTGQDVIAQNMQLIAGRTVNCVRSRVGPAQGIDLACEARKKHAVFGP